MSIIDNFKNWKEKNKKWKEKNKKKTTIFFSICFILALGFNIYDGGFRRITNKINESFSDKKEDSNYQTLSPKSRCEKYIDDNSLLHSYTPLQIIEENSGKGTYIYYTSVCYGEKYNCEYNNVYISTKNSGLTWDIEF